MQEIKQLHGRWLDTCLSAPAVTHIVRPGTAGADSKCGASGQEDAARGLWGAALLHSPNNGASSTQHRVHLFDLC